MAGETQLVRALLARVDERIKRHTVAKIGIVGQVNAATVDDPIPTLTVAGIKMAYSDAITTPAVGDVVVYLAREKFVIARRA